jgi:hypothetical protein
MQEIASALIARVIVVVMDWKSVLRRAKRCKLVWIATLIAMLFIAISLVFLFPLPSAHTNHTPVCQSAHQQALSADHKALYLAPFSPRGVSSEARAFVDVASSTNFIVGIRTTIKEYLACTNETEK